MIEQHYIDSTETAQALLHTLRQQSGPFGLDCETVGCNPKKQSPVGTARIICFTIGWLDADNNMHGAFVWGEYLDDLKPWLESDAPKVGANFTAYDMHCFENHGIEVGGLVHDIKHTSRLWYSSKDVNHGLKAQAAELTPYTMTEYADIFSRPTRNKPKVYKTFRYSTPKSGPLAGVPTLTCPGEVAQLGKERELIPLDEFRSTYAHRQSELVRYATLDACATLAVATQRERQLDSRKARVGTALEFYRSVWNPMLLMLSSMERTGIQCDLAACLRVQSDATHEAKVPYADIVRATNNHSFNPASSDQLREYLAGELGLKPSPIQGTLMAVKPADPGKFHTSEAALYWLQLHNPEHNDVLDSIRRWRKIRKSFQFGRDIPGYMDTAGRIHTVLSPEADTGRLSAKLPALQQIPSKNDLFGIRAAFVSAPRHSLVVADYSQLEVYVLAHMLIKLFNDDSVATALASGDVYTWLARKCWPLETAAWTDADFKAKGHPANTKRNLAKVLVLATNYGKTPAGLALSLLDETGEPASEQFCRDLLDLYMNALPGVAQWQQYIADYARQYGGVPTLLGRWRPIPIARSTKAWEARRGARQALNSPIQGGAMDIATLAMLGLNTYSRVPGGWFNADLAALGARCLLQVHDELIFEVPDENAEAAKAIIEHGMTNLTGLELALPLRVEANIGKSWKEAK